MVVETIKVIKAAEAKAEAIVKGADEQCERILDDASKEAEQLKEDQIENMQEKAEAMMAEAKETDAQSQQTAMKNVEIIIEALKELGFTKEEEAINLVLAELV